MAGEKENRGIIDLDAFRRKKAADTAEKQADNAGLPIAGDVKPIAEESAEVSSLSVQDKAAEILASTATTEEHKAALRHRNVDYCHCIFCDLHLQNISAARTAVRMAALERMITVDISKHRQEFIANVKKMRALLTLSSAEGRILIVEPRDLHNLHHSKKLEIRALCQVFKEKFKKELDQFVADMNDDI